MAGGRRSRSRLGSGRPPPFEESGSASIQPLLARLRNRKVHISGRCARCPFFDLCGGGSRVRAEALSGDLWASDPGCHLTDEELRLVPVKGSDNAPPEFTKPDSADLVLPECAAPGV